MFIISESSDFKSVKDAWFRMKVCLQYFQLQRVFSEWSMAHCLISASIAQGPWPWIKKVAFTVGICVFSFIHGSVQILPMSEWLYWDHTQINDPVLKSCCSTSSVILCSACGTDGCSAVVALKRADVGPQPLHLLRVQLLVALLHRGHEGWQRGRARVPHRRPSQVETARVRPWGTEGNLGKMVGRS